MAREIMAKKTNLRVLTADFDVVRSWKYQESRSILGGMLHQDADRVIEARSPWPPEPSDPRAPTSDLRVVTKRQPTAEEWTALRFAWRVCAHVKSNAVIFTAADRTVAVGAGQMSRVDAVKVAVMKAPPGSLKGTVAASDAFFPFRAGLDAGPAAGPAAVGQPGGSVPDAAVLAAAGA